MTLDALLARWETKSRAPITRAHLDEVLSRYADTLFPMTWDAPDGTLAGYALLQLPVRAMGRTTCGLLAAVSDGSVDTHRALETIKAQARALGADTLMFATHRRPEAFVRRFGAVIDSVNLRWDLTKETV